MFSRNKQKTILCAFLISVVLIVVASLLIMLFIFDTERAQKKKIEDFERTGILSESDVYEFKDTLPQIPDTSWINEVELYTPKDEAQATGGGNPGHRGIVDAEMYYDTTRNELPVDLAEDDAIAMTDSVNYNDGTYFELTD